MILGARTVYQPMLIGEPPPSQADLHFRLFGIPVRVHPWFWIVSLMLGISGPEKADPTRTLVWVAVVFVSVLVHELGHAFVQRWYGGRPWITLYSFGGLASCGDCDRSPKSQILISLAGPAAGFGFAALLLLAVNVAGHSVFRVHSLDQASIEQWLAEFKNGVWFFDVLGLTFGFEGFSSLLANLAMQDLLYVNIWWGLVNLLPIYPLDGGQVAREVLSLGHPQRGIVYSLWLSMGAAAAVAIYALSNNLIFTTFMFGYLAYASYQTLQRYQSHWR